MRDLVWVEKYRPSIDSIIGLDINAIKELLKNPVSMPHMLFVSRSPGTGKTSAMYAIAKYLGVPAQDIIIMNSSDDRKLETVRGRIKDFAMSMRSDPDKPRLILLDEFDGMLAASQDALRNIMETYQSNCKFIMTANREDKIIDPIKSRCMIVRLTDPPKGDIAGRLRMICSMENVNCSSDALTKIIDIHYPDMRAMINHLQQLASSPITLERVKSGGEMSAELYGLLKLGNPREARKYVIENGLDVRESIKEIMETTINDEALREKTNYPERLNKFVADCAEQDYRMSVGADQEIQMAYFIYEWISVWR